ncbi:MAG: hypothetical protein ACP5N7_01840 [Candidatus Pacearchaeota archaeon]
MVNKKSVSIIFASFVFLSIFAFVVSAQTTSTGPNAFFRSVTADAKEFFVRLADYRNNNNLTVTVLLSFLVFMIIGSIVNIIPLFAKRDWLPRTLISLVITALSVMLIPREILALAINPYSALGIVIITVIPFIFMFTFVHATIRNVFFRRAIWMLFVLSFLILGLYNLYGADTSDVETWYSMVYFVGCLLAAGMIWKGEELEYKIFKGKLAAGETDAKEYLRTRKLQMEFDRQRAAVELGVDDDSKLSRRKLS